MPVTDEREDRGEAPEAVATALTAYAADPARATDVLAALVGSRLLLPSVAVPAEQRDPADGHCDERAAVLLQRPDGRTGLLAFTSLAAMARWRADARPVPVPTQEAAHMARHEGAAALVVDVAGPTRFVVDGDDLAAVAAGVTLAPIGDRSGGVRASAVSRADGLVD